MSAGESANSGSPQDLGRRLEDRLADLRSKLQLGQRRLRELEQEQAVLQQQVLRISGAVQALEEVLMGAANTDAGGTTSMAAPPPA